MGNEKKEEMTSKTAPTSGYIKVVKDKQELEVPISTLKSWIKNGYKEK